MIRVENISKSFANELILDGISFTIKKGECIVFNGVSGSGKSTLLSIIATLMRASQGSIFIEDKNITKLSDFELSSLREKKIGVVPQSFHLFDALNVKDNVILGLLISSLSDEEIQVRLQEVMKMAAIEHKAKTLASKLSGGEKQRCMLARALVNRPEIILCDEPTANLDKKNTLKFIELIEAFKKQGKTIAIATHDPLISEMECVDTVMHIKRGKLEMEKTVDE